MLIVILLIYLFIFGQLATLLLRRFFGFTKNFSTLVLGMFLVGVTASWLGGLALIFFTWQPVTFASVLVLNGLLYVPALRYKKSSYSQDSSVAQPDNAMRVDVWTVLGVVVFFACLVYGFILLSQSRSGDAILTPWQTISPLYIYVFFIATFTLGLLIFSSLKTKTILLFLILQTFLLHSYLPMSHKFIYGADGWRHIANEQRFLEGKKLFFDINITCIGIVIFWHRNFFAGRRIRVIFTKLLRPGFEGYNSFLNIIYNCVFFLNIFLR